MTPELGVTVTVPAAGCASVWKSIAFEVEPSSRFSVFVMVTLRTYFVPNFRAPGSNRKVDLSFDSEIEVSLTAPAGKIFHLNSRYSYVVE